jgi:hypothetical protein
MRVVPKCARCTISHKRPIADEVDGSCSTGVDCAIVQLLGVVTLNKKKVKIVFIFEF